MTTSLLIGLGASVVGLFGLALVGLIIKDLRSVEHDEFNGDQL